MKNKTENINGLHCCYRRKPAMLLAGILLLAAACSKDPAADIPGNGTTASGKTVTAAFEFTQDFEQAVEVKAAGTEDVSTINDLWVLQLAADGTCLLQSPLYFSSLESVNGNYRAEFKVQEAPCKMVFVANTHDKKAYAGLSLTSTEAEAAAVTREITAEADLTVSGAPMSGTWSGTPVTSVPGKVSMSRAICKVNFNIGADLPTGDSYEMLSLQVRQVPAVLNYYRDDATLNDFPYPDAATSGFFDYPLQAFENLQFVGGGGYSANNQEFMWYFPENSRGIGTATDPFHKTAETTPAGQADYCTYVELYGKYFDASAPVDEQSFITTYRIYLGANNKADFNLLRNHAYTVNVTLRGKNEVDMRVESVLKPANCYMVSEPSTEYTFNATIMGNGCFTPYYEGNGENAPAIVPSRLSPDDAMLVWETGAAGDVIEPGSVKLSADRKFISFRTSATIGGNAVIAAMQNGDIIWSWHIWSTEYDPETSYDTYVTQTIDNASYNSLPSRETRMMKVNLGATSLTSTPGDINCYGLYYQWGRKDPFVGAKALTGTESSAFGNLTATTTNYSGYDWKLYKLPTNFTSDDAIVYAVGLPTYFISAVSTDWMPLERSNLWGNPNETTKMPNMDQGSKSIYDPCPAGWRVPPSDTWTMFTSSGIKVSSAADINADGWNYGYNFYCGGWGVGNTAYYPAAGYRKGTGTVIGQLVLDSGDYWSSSSYSKMNQYSCSLMFRSGNVNPLYSGMDVYRINGRTVRCAREE